MDETSLVMRSGHHFKFDSVGFDCFLTHFTSLVASSEIRAELILLSVQGGYDNQMFACNDLRIYLEYLDDSSGDVIRTDISSQVAQHYSTQLLIAYPTVEGFTLPALRYVIDLVTYYEPNVATADREDRARAILANVYANIAVDIQLGSGGRMRDLDSLHWFSLIHGVVPIAPVDLGALTLEPAGNNVDITTFSSPFTLRFSSGDIATSRTRRERADPLHPITAGAFTYDLSIVYHNLLSDTVDQLRNDVDAIFAQLAQMDADLATALQQFDGVQNTTNAIDLRLVDQDAKLTEATSLVRDIADQISHL